MDIRDDLDLGIGGPAGRIPVFVFPSSLVFSGGNERDHIRQILTIYNPYDFPVYFRVLSTTPNYFNVAEPEGSIQAKNCVDLIIRLTSNVPFDSPDPIESKFRVQVFHYTSKQVLGRKDVLTTIIYGSQEAEPGGIGMIPGSTPSMTTTGFFGRKGSGVSDIFLPTGLTSGGTGSSSSQQQHSSGSRSSGSRQQQARNSGGSGAEAQQFPGGPQINYVAIVTGLVCILGLMLPSEKDDPGSTILPPYLHLSVNQKLLVAYTLGLVTMVIFRP